MTTLLKCKMCGGTLEIQENETVARCRYCGSIMTIPHVDSEKKARMFNRANEYRINAEFDQAFEAYKAIAAENPEEPEAYWGMVLSEYGIEYVEDPKTGKRIPTCHRTSPTSIKNSSNYKLAVQNADAEQKMMYEDEAKEIDQIQKRILAVSSREEPYDVFICYKETDDTAGERTTDSVLAQDIYNELTKQGIKTFFSRITLEDKLGVDYEPYIYAALRSAKVMLVVTENPDNCEAVWVKNEWMRFLNFMKEDSSKTIIPVYRNITAYELPSELARFQSQDMSKIGAIQDLVRGVQKLVSKEVDSEDQVLLKKLIEEKRVSEEKKKKSEEDRAHREEERKQKELQEEQRKRELAEKKKAQEERKKAEWQKKKKWVILGSILAVGICAFLVVYNLVILPKQRLEKAESLLSAGQYDEAYSILEDLGNNEMIASSMYERAVALHENGDIESAMKILNVIENSDQAPVLLKQKALNVKSYIEAIKYYEAEKYSIAFEKLQNAGSYKDTSELLNKLGEIIYQNALELEESGEYDEAMKKYDILSKIDYKDSAKRIETIQNQLKEAYKNISGYWYCEQENLIYYFDEAQYYCIGESNASRDNVVVTRKQYEYRYKINSDSYALFDTRHGSCKGILLNDRLYIEISGENKLLLIRN